MPIQYRARRQTKRQPYNAAIRVTGMILKGIYLVLLILIPLNLVLLTFHLTLPMSWLLPALGRSLLIAFGCFVVGCFWMATSSK